MPLWKPPTLPCARMYTQRSRENSIDVSMRAASTMSRVGALAFRRRAAGRVRPVREAAVHVRRRCT